jgi:predicted Zn-dependent protease
MINMKKLSYTVNKGLKIIKRVPNLIEGVVYASSNRRSVARIVYTTHIPCNGLEELKSDEDLGVSVELWFKRGNKKYIGFGHETNDLNSKAINIAIEKALRDAVADPDFFGFYKPNGIKNNSKVSRFNADKRLLSLTYKQEAELLANLGWNTISGAKDVILKYSQSKKVMPSSIGFILSGDHFLISERMAVANTNGVLDSEESSVILSFFTAMIEKENAKGSAWKVSNDLRKMNAKEIGSQAAKAAIKNISGIRLNTGKYNVIFGPQAVTEIFGSLLLPHFSLGLVDFGASLFQGQYGKSVASSFLSITDDPTLKNAGGSKRITCEGIPTKRTQLLKNGKLVGYLSDSRMTNKLLNKKEEALSKIGINSDKIKPALYPGNGFRFSRGGGRIASSSVGIHATNLLIKSSKAVSEADLIEKVNNGVYIGRLWYTYPVGGYASGIISGTVIADSFIIRNGKFAEPLLPNCVRIEDNLLNLINSIIGIASNPIQTILWASDEITNAPWIAIKNVNLYSINSAQLN